MVGVITRTATPASKGPCPLVVQSALPGHTRSGANGGAAAGGGEPQPGVTAIHPKASKKRRIGYTSKGCESIHPPTPAQGTPGARPGGRLEAFENRYYILRPNTTPTEGPTHQLLAYATSSLLPMK